MKKIFATILALVMVLAMGSSLAMNCLSIDWSTVTNCGVGTVEVIPYVISNGAGGTNVFTANDCAGAINGQYIYYAVKVTVQEQPNQTWWDEAELNLDFGDGLRIIPTTAATSPGMVMAYTAGGTVGTTSILENLSPSITGLDRKLALAKDSTTGGSDVSAGTYYLAGGAVGGAANMVFTSSFSPTNNLFASLVGNINQNVEVCATLKSEATITPNVNIIDINGKDVWINDGGTRVVGTDGTADWWINVRYSNNVTEILFDGENFLGVQVDPSGGAAPLIFNNYYPLEDKYSSTTGETAEASCTNRAYYNIIREAFAAINFQWDQDVSEQTAIDRLTWKGESKSCKTWGSAATAIVDTNCVIEIPKTGDVSVVAYAVMALVTAAGALKFRK